MRNTVQKDIICRCDSSDSLKQAREIMIPHSDLMNQALAQLRAGGVLVLGPPACHHFGLGTNVYWGRS